MTNKISHSSMSPAKQSETPVGNRVQNYVVEDETMPNSVDDRLAQFEAPSQSGNQAFQLPTQKTSISKDLENLIFIGRITREVEIGGAKFEISSLTNREHNDVVKSMYRFAEAADLFTIRVLTLANALKKINGIDLDDFDIDGDFEDDYHKRMTIVDSLQLSVVEKLFNEYEKIAVEEEAAVKDSGELKNS